MIGLYIHIPFCRTLCPYCDFARQAIPGAVPGVFIDALCREIGAFEGPDEAGTVFIGGGTPSLLRPGALERILTTVRRRFQLEEPEITIEANPDDVDAPLADAWCELGINRLSLGVQSFGDAVLRYLGRRHNAACARRACACVAERFDNWSMDLIFGGHPVDTWPATLDQCRAFAPKHVSAYGLTYAPETPFGARVAEAVDDATWLDLYLMATAVLKDYAHYEVSNFALPGFTCKHNLIYWRNEEYAGFGPAAYSFINGIRARNPIRLEDYLAQPGHKAEMLRLADTEIRIETVIQHFRLKAGLNKVAYLRRFGRDVRVDFAGPIDALIARGLVEEDAQCIRPTPQGFVLNNEIGLTLVGH